MRKVALAGLLLGSAVQWAAAQPPPVSMHPCVLQGHYRECVDVRLAGADLDRHAKSFPAPPAGHAYVYVLRPHGQQSRQAVTISLDGLPGAVLGPMTYARLLVPAGSHELQVRADEALRMPLQLAGGQIHVLEYELVLVLGTTRPVLRPLELVAARSKMARASLVDTTDSE